VLSILKWSATATLIVGFGLFSAGVEIGWYFQILGGFMWATAAWIMRDRPLIWTNMAMTTVGILGKLFG